MYILLAMTFPLGTRVYTMLTIAVAACAAGSGACFGLVLDGRTEPRSVRAWPAWARASECSSTAAVR